MKKIALLICCLSLLSAFQVNTDGSPVDYSKIAVGSRYWGMGKAGVAFADDPSGVYLNPAAYGVMKTWEVSAMSTKVLGEFNYTFISGVFQVEKETFGITYLDENPGIIKSVDGVDAYGHPLEGDKLEAYARIISFGYGRKAFLDDLYLGGSLKFLKKKLDFIEANAAMLDLGALYRWSDDLALGLTVKNAWQNRIAYSNKNYYESVDPELITGVAWSFWNKTFILAIDQHTNNEFGRTNVGVEYWLASMVALRLGLVERDMTAGFGFKYELFQLDVAINFKEAPLDNQLFFSLSYGDASNFLLGKPEIEILDYGPLPDKEEDSKDNNSVNKTDTEVLEVQ